jgi:D-lactate dehydrogenase (cytochrome)
MDPALIRDLKSLLGPANILSQKEDWLLYEFDGSVEKARPEAVVFPHTTEHVSRIVKLAAKYQVPVVAVARAPGFPAERWRAGAA